MIKYKGGNRMNWRGIKRRLKRNPALLDMNYRALPGTAEAMARSMRAFSEMAETVRLRASLTEERRNMLAHAINPEPRSHRRRACAMLSCALAVILLLATAVSGVFLPGGCVDCIPACGMPAKRRGIRFGALAYANGRGKRALRVAVAGHSGLV